MPVEKHFTIHSLGGGDPNDEQQAREYARAFELIVAFVHTDQFDGLDRVAVANALGSATAHVLREAGMSHATCVTLFEALAHYERAAELDEADPEGSA
jgi:hypothetical protein